MELEVETHIPLYSLVDCTLASCCMDSVCSTMMHDHCRNMDHFEWHALEAVA